MKPDEIIQRRVARELHPATLVNLGIGLPTGVSRFVAPDSNILFQSENGIVGMGARPNEGMEDVDLTDAGGGYITAVPGAATVDSTMSFGLIRGGHLDATVLGGLEIDQWGRLANWMVPGKMVPGMGGAMDLVAGARRVIIAMFHTARGRSKIVPNCTLPLTSIRPVTLLVTEMAVIEPTPDGLLLRERAPGVSVEDIFKATSALLKVSEDVPEMDLQLSTGASRLGRSGEVPIRP
jgi:acetate CoA/acetoacetate CoA-transferase beta subunit